MQTKEYKLRRDGLLKQMDANSLAIIFAAKEFIRNGAEHYPYRQNSDFYYLTGFMEPEAIAVLIPGRKEGEFVLFNRAHDATKELWYGPFAGQKGACREFGADQSFPITEVDHVLPQLLADRNHVYYNIGSDRDFDLKVASWTKKSKIKVTAIGKILHEMRIKKSEAELQLMRKAAEITAAAHLRAMHKCCPGMHEYELAAELLYEFERNEKCDIAFKTIIGGGKNACTLHYTKNSDKLNNGDLVLVDAGVEYNYYSSDVSRTFPVNGRFTPEQRAIYEAVLDAQLEVIGQIRPGIRFDSLQLSAERIITERLIDLKLLKGKADELLANQSFKAFFMHKIGHWIGLDAHDVGDYHINNKWRILEPGMVLTVEPGIYITPNISVASKWKNIGVRIEDEVLVTKNGCDVLTKMLPKTVSEIEIVMKK